MSSCLLHVLLIQPFRRVFQYKVHSEHFPEFHAVRLSRMFRCPLHNDSLCFFWFLFYPSITVSVSHKSYWACVAIINSAYSTQLFYHRLKFSHCYLLQLIPGFATSRAVHRWLFFGFFIRKTSVHLCGFARCGVPKSPRSHLTVWLRLRLFLLPTAPAIRTMQPRNRQSC